MLDYHKILIENYFGSSTKSFSDLYLAKFLNILAKLNYYSFFLCMERTVLLKYLKKLNIYLEKIRCKSRIKYKFK